MNPHDKSRFCNKEIALFHWQLKANMNTAIKETQFKFPNQTGFYKGKVRDVYMFEDKIAIVATDRISAFDVVLPLPIPFTGP